MAIRARSDNLSLDIPAGPAVAPAPVTDFAEVWAQREALRQACVRMIGDPARAEDLVQDTFMSALKCGGRLNEGRPVAPWLKTVARRRSIDELRGRDRVALMAEPPEPLGLSVDDPADHVVSQELVAQLRRAIAELSIRERQLLLRQASYGLSLAELAAEEDTSIASVRSVLARARQKLRLSLERGGVFGVLPLPRYLSTMRERLFRWGSQLEPTLPAMTGVGARFGEAVAAVITAIALFITGGGLPNFGGSTVMTTDLASANGPSQMDAGSSASFGPPPAPRSGGGGGAGTTGSRPTVPGVTPLAPLPPVLDDAPNLPNDGTSEPDNSGITHFSASADGQAVIMSALSGSSGTPTIFRSLDGGQAWARLTDDSIGHMQRHRTFLGGNVTVAPTYPTDPRVFAVSPQNVVHRSEDGGLSFTPVVGARGAVVLSPGFSTDDKAFVAGPPPAVYDDRTQTLQPFGAPPVSRQWGGIAIGPDYATTGEVLVGGVVTKGTAMIGAVYTCTTSGCVTRGVIPEIDSAVEVHVSKTSPGTVFAWDEEAYFRSTDGGRTFSRVVLPTGFWFTGMTEDEDRVLAFGSDHPGTAAPMYSSTDGGATWTAVGAGSFVRTGVRRAIALGGGRIIAAPTGMFGPYCSVDDGVTWTRRCPS